MRDSGEDTLAPAAARVCVIIAAFGAQHTVGRAVASALAQPEVSEVIVIDDASTDATAAAAQGADDGSGRLIVQRLALNAGPSAARNLAIARSSAPFVAILDADDFLLPGRFADLLAIPDWDIVADNIAFVDEGRVDTIDPARIAAHRATPLLLTPAAFVAGCISRADRYKGELGFLKPVLSRGFLDAHGLRYAEEMRLAEDYDLYVRALMAGARFRLAAGCGYVAVERRGSLSSQHGVAELASVEDAAARLLAVAPPDPALRRQLRRHHAQAARKHRHRALLASKREVGLIRAIRDQVSAPGGLLLALVDVAGDKLRAGRQTLFPPTRSSEDPIRFLR